jgi:hypothetical protein
MTRFMDKLLVSQTLEDCQHWLELRLAEISWQRYKKRMGRSFPGFPSVDMENGDAVRLMSTALHGGQDQFIE